MSEKQDRGLGGFLSVGGGTASQSSQDRALIVENLLPNSRHEVFSSSVFIINENKNSLPDPQRRLPGEPKTK